MKLLLHIGTHKTATSSLQLFLRRNYTLMQSHGIYYPVPPGGKKNFNNVAERLARGSVQRTIKIFQEIYRTANKKRFHHVVISAESFYSMTNFYGNGLKEETGSYFVNEGKRIKDLQKTWGTINGNPKFQPIAPHEMVWNGICSRPNEIVLRFKSVRDASGGRVKVPYCYTAASNGKTGHIDFAAMLQGDGTPYGGSLESQTHENDYSNIAYK